MFFRIPSYSKSSIASKNALIGLVFVCMALTLLSFRDMSMPISSHRSVSNSCIVETCNDDWTSTDGVVNVNQDNAGCSTLRSMLRMRELKPNITGHWCKAYRAVQQCDRKNYRYMIFRDDDTIIDIHRLLAIARRSKEGVVASYKADKKRIITNWFLVDTSNERACDKMRQWWALARWHHPEHDQLYFNRIFQCGKPGINCIDKRTGILNEVHCRSSLGNFRSLRRQACLRYQVKPRPELL